MTICSSARWLAFGLACSTAMFAQQTQLPSDTTQGAPTTQAAPAEQPAAAQTPGTAGQQTPGATGTQTPALQPHDGPAPDAGAFRISRTVNEVDLIFTVLDKNGHFVNGLQQNNFGLLDDGRPPERVIKFQQQTNLPLRVGIMLDTSSSIRERFVFEQESATDFLLQVLHPADRAFVEGFDVQVNITQDFTNRVDQLDTGIRKLRPGGGTALYDSLYRTCRDQMLTLKQDVSVRKAIVLVSDGDDDYSRVLQTEAIKMCQRAETIVYAISTDVNPTKDKGDDVLQAIADATGGQAFFPRRIDDVAQGFRAIEEELRSQYLLQYVPADFKRDGAFRTIYLNSNDPRYTVRTKKGYFAPLAQ
jgi:VWFA-related protein